MSFWHRLNRRYQIRYRIEYAIAAAIVYGVRAMSPAFAWAGARSVGRLVFHLGLRRKVMMTNLAIAFPDKSEAERREIALRSVQHFACMAVDIILQRRFLRRTNILRKMSFGGWTARYMQTYGVQGLRHRSTRTLFVSGHFGNWEIGSGFFGLLGVRIDPVFRPPRNPWVAKLIRNVRLESQYEYIEKSGAVRQMIERFDAGGNVGFLFDQEAAHGVEIPFFGRNARTHKTPAVLAHDCGIKIYFGAFVRKGDNLEYEARGELLDLTTRSEDRDEDIYLILEELVKRLEGLIRRHPEQYFWMHRRWKRSGAHKEDPS